MTAFAEVRRVIAEVDPETCAVVDALAKRLGDDDWPLVESAATRYYRACVGGDMEGAHAAARELDRALRRTPARELEVA